MVEAAAVQAWAAVRGLASIPPGTQPARYERAWNFQFARVPSSFVLVLALWWQLEAEAEQEEAKMGA